MKRLALRVPLYLISGGVSTLATAWLTWLSRSSWVNTWGGLHFWSGSWLVDLLSFTVLWLIVFESFRFVRNERRAIEGHCPKCNYDLRGLPSPSGSRGSEQPGCPECGWGRDDADGETS